MSYYVQAEAGGPPELGLTQLCSCSFSTQLKGSFQPRSLMISKLSICSQEVKSTGCPRLLISPTFLMKRLMYLLMRGSCSCKPFSEKAWLSSLRKRACSSGGVFRMLFKLPLFPCGTRTGWRGHCTLPLLYPKMSCQACALAKLSSFGARRTTSPYWKCSRFVCLCKYPVSCQ